MLKKMMSILCIILTITVLLVGCSKPTTTSTPTASKEPAKYPTRPVEIIVPYAPGGGVDMNGRALAPSLERALKGTVIVNNKEGGSAGIGSSYVAKSKPDGYTMGIGNIASIVGVSIMNNVGFDPVKDIKWVGVTATDTFMIGVAANSPYNSVKDVIEYLKKNPGALKYGASGGISMDAMLAYNLESAGGVDINIVNFNGGSEIAAAILGGHVQLYGGSWSEMKALVQDGKVKIIGVGGDKRLTDLPNVPTFAEQGYPMAFNTAKRSIFVPSNIDPAIVKAIEAGVKTAVADPDFVEKAKKTGLVPQYLSPEDCLKEAQTVADWFKANKDKIVLGK